MSSYPYHGDFCITHREHMRSHMGIPVCEKCEKDREWAADQARKHNAECEEEIERIHGKARPVPSNARGEK